jgi:hypothetical protein
VYRAAGHGLWAWPGRLDESDRAWQDVVKAPLNYDCRAQAACTRR